MQIHNLGSSKNLGTTPTILKRVIFFEINWKQCWNVDDSHSLEKYYKARSRFLRINQHFFREINVFTKHSVEKYSKTLSQFLWKKLQIFRQIEADFFVKSFYYTIKPSQEIVYNKFSRNFAQGFSIDFSRGRFKLHFEIKRPGKVWWEK